MENKKLRIWPFGSNSSRRSFNGVSDLFFCLQSTISFSLLRGSLLVSFSDVLLFSNGLGSRGGGWQRRNAEYFSLRVSFENVSRVCFVQDVPVEQAQAFRRHK
jgi:hypothetical protein